MLDKMTNRLDFHGNALLLRAERQRAIASNIANADTPGLRGPRLQLCPGHA
jgi:flagellar basal-body rod protein FlgB